MTKIDRRQILKALGASGVVSYFAAGRARGACELLNVTAPTSTDELGGMPFQYFIDGLNFGSRTDLPVRANLALWSGPYFQQSWISSAALAGPDGKVIELRRLPKPVTFETASPYIIFENLALDPSVEYSFYWRQKFETESDRVFSFEFTSKNTSFISTSLANRIRTLSGLGGLSGLATTPFEHHNTTPWRSSADGRVKSIAADGEFAIEFYAVAAARFIAVLDPVGRVLGFKENPIASASRYTVNRLTSTEKDSLGLLDDQVADIRECPYIQCLYGDTEHVSRTVIRLR